MKYLTMPAVCFALFAGSPQAFAVNELHKKHACTACHTDDRKLVGPAYQEVAKAYGNPKDPKYKGDRAKTIAHLSEKVRKGGMGVWGPTPMPPNASASDAEIKTMIEAVLDSGKTKK